MDQATPRGNAMDKKYDRILLILLGVGLVWATSCESIQLGPANEPLSARYRAQGSACEVVVRFTDIVLRDARRDPEFYRLGSGGSATRVETSEDDHAVVVFFDRAVGPGEEVLVGAADTPGTPLTVGADETDTTPPQLVDVRFPVDAAAPTVLLTFDEALDPVVAADPARYALGGTISHPVRATPQECGRTVALVFDQLDGTTALDIDGLTDLSGVTLEPRAGAPVTRADDETPPTMDDVVFPSNAERSAVWVAFSEVVDRASAETAGNYVLDPGGVAPTSVTLQPGGRAVVLAFDSIDPPVTLSVSDVVDLNNIAMRPVAGRGVAAALDTLPPGVEGATFAGRDADGRVQVRVRFTEAIAASTAVRGAHYVLVTPVGGEPSVPATVVLEPGARSVVVTFPFIPPDAELEVTGVSDLNGNALDDRVRVTLDADSDDVAPRVRSAGFVPNSASPTIAVTFDKALDENTASDTTRYVLSGGAGISSAALQTDGRTVYLTAAGLDREDTLAVSGVTDRSGNVMIAAAGLAIGAGADEDPPGVASTTFDPDAASPTLRVEFTEAVDKSTAQTGANYVGSATEGAARVATLADDGRTVLLTFGPVSSVMNLSISNVTDLAGLSLPPTVMPVGAGADTVSPGVASAAFVANQVVPTVDVAFSEAVDRTLAQTPGLYLVGSDRVAPTSALLRDDGHTVRLLFPPVRRTDTLDVRSIIDLSGNEMPAVSSLSIQAAGDTDRPIVVSAAFTANATAPTVRMIFSEAVDEASAETLTNYRVVTTGASPTRAVLQTDARTVELTLPSINRDETLTVRGVNDFAGLPTDSGAPIVVARDPELTPPTVSSASVTSSTQVTIVFSEAVDARSAGTIGNYKGFSSGLSVASVTRQSDGRTIVLTVQGGTVSAGDTLDIAYVSDLNGNVMVPVNDRVLQ